MIRVQITRMLRVNFFKRNCIFTQERKATEKSIYIKIMKGDFMKLYIENRSNDVNGGLFGCC